MYFGNIEKEWDDFSRQISEISAGHNGWQSTVNNELSVSFVHVEDVVYDGHRVLTEVNFKFLEEKQVEIILKYNEHIISLHNFSGLELQLQGLNLVDKAHFVLTFINRFPICSGFTSDLSDDTPLSDKSYVMHYIQDPKDQMEIKEKRFFSSRCLVFTDTLGLYCSRCQCAKYQLDKVKKRHAESAEPNPRCNHRYLSREEILNKVTQEKKKHFKEQRAREHLESEMLHMDRDDHTDLLTMMSTIDKNDVPEDPSIIWEQQSKILATESSHGYRWHPK